MTRVTRGSVLAVGVLILAMGGCGKAGEQTARQVLRSIDQGKITGTKGTMETFSTALRSYSVDHGGYPKTSSMQEATAALVPAALVAPVGPDAWGNPFSYSSDGASFTLTAPGQDGVLGTPDDVIMVDGRFTQIPSPGGS